MAACFFAGHRKITMTEELDEALDRELLSLIESGTHRFYTGGVPGWDMLCAMRILRMKKELPQLELYMVIPCPPELQCAGWSFEDQFVYNALYHGADGVEQLFPEYRFDCMTCRNRRLAEYSDTCLCWYDESRNAGNTGQAVRYAQEKSAQLINMFVRK